MRISLKTSLIWLATLALGVVGGFAFDRLGVPLAWLLGSLGAVAVVSLMGARLAVPPGARQTGQITLGIAIGLTFAPEVAAFVAGFLPIMIGAAFLSIGYGVLAGRILRRTSGVGDATAFFASVPGGVVEMSVQAERYGGDTAPVALAQSLRILFVVVTIPPIITVLGLTGVDPFELRTLAFDPAGLVILTALGLAIGWALARRRIANAWFLGPMGVAVIVSVVMVVVVVAVVAVAVVVVVVVVFVVAAAFAVVVVAFVVVVVVVIIVLPSAR